MSQPFRSGSVHDSLSISGVRLLLLEDRIEICLPQPVYALSSAVHPGGFSSADRILNWKVPLTYQGEDPVKDFIQSCTSWSCDPERTIGLLTAAKLTHASIQEAEGNRFSMLCCVTVGTRNAARAGMKRNTYPAYTAGTINTVVLIDGRLTESAMVNAIITATEAKTAALQQLGIVEELNGLSVTGTTTDAIVIGVSQRPDWDAVHAYAGVATEIGCQIGECVYEAVLEAARSQHEN